MEYKIISLLEARFKEDDMSDCFVLEVKLEKSKKLKIFIDSDEGITYRKCARISRFLEAEIEENEWLPENYSIDVSSPGAEKPLKKLRQYKKHIGRSFDVKMLDEDLIQGELLEVLENGIKIKPSKSDAIDIAFDTIKESTIKLKFK